MKTSSKFTGSLYEKIKKVEPKESTAGGASSGAYDSPLFGEPTKGKINKINNFKEGDIDEATAGGASTGAYDAPFGDGGKNPLKIGGNDSIMKSRAVKDKNFPKWGGPGGVYVKVKEKCKHYPYCNQGDIKALDFFESESLKKTIEEVSKEKNIPYKHLEQIVLNEINKIFI